MSYERELQTAVEAARAAGLIQQSHVGNLVGAEVKADKSPVTEVDRLCESCVRETLRGVFPGDGFLGEETGESAGTTGRTWIVDPLDGTRPYLRGIPTYSTLIALEVENRLVVGVIHFGATGQTYWATDGGGAFHDGRPIRVSAVDDSARALGSALGYVQKAGEAQGRCLLGLMRKWDYCYGFMDACTYADVASGRIDVCVNVLDKPWDCAAPCCIVREAGGRYSDIHGVESVRNGSVVVSNGLLHDHVIEHFRNCMKSDGGGRG